MKPVYRRTVLSSFASLALAACGGSEGAPPAPTPPAPTPTPTPTPSPAPSPTHSPPPVPAPAAPTVIDEGANRLIVSVLQEGVLRLRVGPNRVFENDQGPQLMVVKPDSAWPGAVNQDGRPDVIKTAAFELTIRRNPVSVTLR